MSRSHSQSSAALRQPRDHARKIEHAGLVDHVAALDAGRLVDELDARIGNRGNGARGDDGGIFLVESRAKALKAATKIVVADDFLGDPKAAAADGDVVHDEQAVEVKGRG